MMERSKPGVLNNLEGAHMESFFIFVETAVKSGRELATTTLTTYFPYLPSTFV
jgi:hypothetical protein